MAGIPSPAPDAIIASDAPMTSPAPDLRLPLPSPDEARERPDLRKLLWYSLGGSLPPRYKTWVLHDVTCRTWVLRHFARVFGISTPILVAFFVLLVPIYGTPMALAGVCLAGLFFLTGMIYILIDVDRRAVRAGYPPDYGARVRSRRAAETQHAANHERRERIAARKAVRRAKRYSKL
jgi:hypothetical protein